MSGWSSTNAPPSTARAKRTRSCSTRSRSTIAAGILENNSESLVAWLSNPDRVKPGVDYDDDPARFMPAFEKFLSPEEIQAVAAYLQELK